MTNLYPSTLPLTADHLAAQERYREDMLRAVLAALVEKPGCAGGLGVGTADPESRRLVVLPGRAVWPHPTEGSLVLVEVPDNQYLTVPDGDGPWYITLDAAAQVDTDPVVPPGGGPAVMTRRRRWAISPETPATPAMTVLTPGLSLKTAVTDGELVLGVYLRSKGSREVLHDGGFSRPRLSARLPIIPDWPTREEVIGWCGQWQPDFPHVPTTEEIVAAVLAALPAPEPAPAPDLDALAARVLALLPTPQAQPRAYTVDATWNLGEGLTEVPPLTLTLPEAPPEHGAVTFTGHGDLLARAGAAVTLRPEVGGVPEPTHLWALRDPDLRLGDVLALNGPQAGYYASTVVPSRDGAGVQARGDGGGVLWRHALQRYAPGVSVPVAVVDSALVERPAGEVAAPWELSVLGGSLLWGSRTQAFAVGDATADTVQVTRPSAYVAGRRLIGADRDGITAARVTLTVRGTLLALPLAAAPTLLTVETP